MIGPLRQQLRHGDKKGIFAIAGQTLLVCPPAAASACQQLQEGHNLLLARTDSSGTGPGFVTSRVAPFLYGWRAVCNSGAPQKPPEGRKLLVVGTTSEGVVMDEMGVSSAFNVALHVPVLREPEIHTVLATLRAFAPEEVRGLASCLPPESACGDRVVCCCWRCGSGRQLAGSEAALHLL
jgi:hypothetical protein